MQELLGPLSAMQGSMVYLVGALLLFTVVVFIHELGHFLVARWCGVKIDAFSIGFGPEIFGWHDSQGTRWRFAWIPLGGYVKFIDDADPASATGSATPAGVSESETFRGKAVWQRALIVFAGPFANFLLAAVLSTGMFAVVGEQETTPRVDAIVEGGAAEAAGFQVGDVIMAIDDATITRFPQLQQTVAMAAGKTLIFTVRRGDTLLDIPATPRGVEMEAYGKTIERGMLGIEYRASANELQFRSVSLIEAAWLGVADTWDKIVQTLVFLWNIVTLQGDANQVGGLVTITKVAGEAASLGVEYFLKVIVLISISLGVINLLPIPVLDGGHLVFFAIEALRGRPLSDEAQEMGLRIGLAIILAIMVLVNVPEIFNEITRLAS